MGARLRPRDRVRVGLLAAATLALVFAVPGPGALDPGRVAPGSGGSGANGGRVTVAPAFVLPAGASELGPVPADRPVSVLVGLSPQDPSGLTARVDLEETPGSPLYERYLTPAALAGEFGASASVRARAASVFTADGLSVRTTSDDLFLEVNGTAAGIDRAFDTQLDRYRVGDAIEFAHSTPASLPAGIPWAGALGLGNTSVVRPAIGPVEAIAPAPAASGCPTAETEEGLLPCQIDRAYNATSLLSSGVNGTGYRLAVVDAYDSAEPQGALLHDLEAFDRNYSLPLTAPDFVYPVPTTVNLNDSASSGWSAENALDLEWARAAAPGATIEDVLSPNPSIGLYESVDWLVAHAAADAISLSWSEPDVGVYNAYSTPCSSGCNATTDGSYVLLHPVLEEAAAEGIGVFAATGDCGAAAGTSGVSTGFPASDPYVTGVGGTVLQINATTGAWSSEAGWSGNASGAKSPGCVNQGGGGGGFAPYPRPSWQAGPGIAANQTQRGEPDVSFNAGQPVVIVIDRQAVAVGGTSAGCPMWAGLELLADQLHGGDLGSLNPSLYALARGSNASTLFHDIVTGNNGYRAGPGWDPVTGLGTPIEDALAPALSKGPPVELTNTSLVLTATPRLGPAPLNATFDLSDVGGAPLDPTFLDVYFGDGNATLVPVDGPEIASGTAIVNHTYTEPGVYEASATYVDRSGNSTTSPPVALVVGGGRPLGVQLSASNATPAVGSSVTLSATVSGSGTTPYLYDFFFGDGTYVLNHTSASIAHAYPVAGEFCPEVVVHDSGAPPDGGGSAPIAVEVGGGTGPGCLAPTPLTANFSSSTVAADLPGDFPLSVDASGGVGPYSVQYVARDPYVRACDCGIFRVPGNYTVTAYVNDSFDAGVVRSLNVTVYPALTANAASTNLTGVGTDPTLNLSWTGGHFTGPAEVNWSFGDGVSENLTTNDSWSTVTPAYPDAGIYLATAVVADQGGGHASASWIVDEEENASGPFAVSATIASSGTSTFGALYRFDATATGGTGPYQYRWSLGQNDSAFGAEANQSYSPIGCLANGSCPLEIGLTVRDAAGAVWSANLSDGAMFFGSSSGAIFTDPGDPPTGTTPDALLLRASATGVDGLSVSWAFGDGNVSSGAEVAHSYYDPGNYTIVETAVDPYGDLLVRSHALVVTGPRYQPLTGALLANVTAGIAPFSVTFDVSATGGTGGPYLVSWAFGDGFTQTTGLGTVAHTYDRGLGNVTAVATVQDAHGDTVALSTELTVYGLTFVAFTVTVAPQPAVYGDPVSYSVQSNVSCTRLSVPGCGNDSAPLTLLLSYDNSSLNGATAAPGAAPVLSNGWANGTLPNLAGYSGPVYVWAVAGGPNYSGAAAALIQVDGAPCSSCGHGGGLGLGNAFDLWLVGLTVAFAAGAALGFALLQRRGRERPPPPSPDPPVPAGFSPPPS